MHVMLTSGISAVRALEITAAVVDNDVYEGILKEALEGVKGRQRRCRRYSHNIPKRCPPLWSRCSR